MRLIIEIPLEGNDLEEKDFDTFRVEAGKASSINLEVSRLISTKEPEVFRTHNLSVEYFSFRVEP